MGSCGDVVTAEAIAAVSLLREYLSTLETRFVNVVDLFMLILQGEHSQGLSNREFKAIFTDDKLVIFNFYSYPGTIHPLTYRRKDQHNLHVQEYIKKGDTDIPLELAVAAIDHVSGLGNKGAAAREANR